MAGRRLLDAALVLTASGRIAQQHFRVRGEQFDIWSRTSTIAKAIKNQTDRITLTATAAAALARRLNEETPEAAREVFTSSIGSSIPDKESVRNEEDNKSRREGFKQDHHYEPSAGNATQDPVPKEDIDIEQREAPVIPTPDGSLPPKDSPIAEKPAGKFYYKGQTESIPRNVTVPKQDEIPEGINTDVFHSPRVSRMLGGRKRPGEIGLGHSVGTPIDQTSPSEGQDQANFNVRRSGSLRPARPAVCTGEQTTTECHHTELDDVKALAKGMAQDVQDASQQAEATKINPRAQLDHVEEVLRTPTYQMRESRVPSSRIGRLWQYGGLATSLAFGAVGETFRRATGSGEEGSLILSAANMERLVAKLSRMRGAALKLGQMMSFQDSKMLPAPIHQVLQRVQDNADYMPVTQRDQVLASNLGPNWQSLFSSFEDVPMAAASIGQVHKAVLASNGKDVAVKIQYPGVATSISSDLNNLSILLTASRLLPKGLFLDKTIANARTELAWECDYKREAECQKAFRRLLADETSTYTVPEVYDEACGSQVLTAELMHGVGVTKTHLQLNQQQRDWLGTNILRLCLRELTEFKFMQTDPNWTNFLFNSSTNKLELLDFGAARHFPDEFVDPYVRILIAASKNERGVIRDLSRQLGYLTGDETKAMENAHVDSVLTLAEPFKETEDMYYAYDFRDQTITDRVRSFIPVMLRERKSPPPEETYSLHRKLSGAFLLLARLGSRVKCREIFEKAVSKWEAS